MTKVVPSLREGISTKIPADAHRKIKVYCAANNLIMGKFVAEAALERIKQSRKKTE
jgi:hypothetical protein